MEDTMNDRQRIVSVSPYEDVIGFSRAVRVGDLVFVSGTVAWGPDGKLVGLGDVYAQAKQTIANIESYLRQAGAGLRDVVRTRIYLTDISRWEDAARAHREAFADVRPASSLLEVSRLASPDMLVEIEAVAVVSPQS
jgi:enamine deaminase RidA (YjgF/YER057c/UK114 family)